jgi:uncharacterized membrane protein YvlD (DUF360 family)
MDTFELTLGIFAIAAFVSCIAMSKKVYDTTFSRIYAVTAWVFAAIVIGYLFW